MLIVGGESTEPDPARTPEIGRLQKIAQEEGVRERVFFAGRRARAELKNYFSAADVFISTPWYEPFGLTPVEAMACATPVIGARVGGIQYTVVDGQTGYLVPANDPQAVTRHLRELYHHPEMLRALSEQAVWRVNEEFTWQKVSKTMATFYEKVLAESREAATAERFAQEIRQQDGAALDEPTLVWQGFDSAIETLQHSQGLLDKSIVEAAALVIRCLERGGKVMVCGNGGSAADAQHFAAELLGRFGSQDRRGLPVFSLTADSVFLTAWSNDIGYEKVFARQVEAFGRPGDLLIGISTSGCSKNVIEAFQLARQMNIECLALLGGSGGDLLSLSTAALVVPSQNTQRIQEVQILVLHLLCELVERHIHAGAFFDPHLLADTLVGEQISLPERRREVALVQVDLRQHQQKKR
jgi:D-inositol-3-phosphate glycosyltransferase